MSTFATLLIAWQRRHGRKGLPWQATRDPYRIWLSEVMLQQTQVSAVIPYYERFLKKYPSVGALALAGEEEVLQLWSGLGYYARGRNLLHAAKEIAFVRGGKFPETAKEIAELPGVGRSTAAAIAAFAFGERAAILDGNVKRVLARYLAVEGWPVDERLWPFAERLLPKNGIETYTQALMDLGATVCTRTKPRCDACPVKARCAARRRKMTDTIPTPRPKKILPIRTATWLLFMHKGSVLMEKRPPTGIWGGLWCFPEDKVGGGFARKQILEPIEHGFTHFRLKIFPELYEIDGLPARLESPGRMWIDIEDAIHAAVPTPVRTLLSAHLAARGARARPPSRAAPASPRAAMAGARRAGR